MKKILSLIAFFMAMQSGAAAQAQSIQITTDSTELVQTGEYLRAYVNKVYDSTWNPPLQAFVTSNKCTPRGEGLDEVRAEGVQLMARGGAYGVLRAGQAIVLKFTLCEDAIVEHIPYLSVDVTTRDLSFVGENGGFSKRTDATVLMYGPDGSLIPFKEPVYNNQNYKKADRSLSTTVAEPGTYKLVITAGKADVGIGNLEMFLFSDNLK